MEQAISFFELHVRRRPPPHFQKKRKLFSFQLLAWRVTPSFSYFSFHSREDGRGGGGRDERAKILAESPLPPPPPPPLPPTRHELCLVGTHTTYAHI